MRVSACGGFNRTLTAAGRRCSRTATVGPRAAARRDFASSSGAVRRRPAPIARSYSVDSVLRRHSSAAHAPRARLPRAARAAGHEPAIMRVRRRCAMCLNADRAGGSELGRRSATCSPRATLLRAAGEADRASASIVAAITRAATSRGVVGVDARRSAIRARSARSSTLQPVASPPSCRRSPPGARSTSRSQRAPRTSASLCIHELRARWRRVRERVRRRASRLPGVLRLAVPAGCRPTLEADPRRAGSRCGCTPPACSTRELRSSAPTLGARPSRRASRRRRTAAPTLGTEHARGERRGALVRGWCRTRRSTRVELTARRATARPPPLDSAPSELAPYVTEEATAAGRRASFPRPLASRGFFISRA